MSSLDQLRETAGVAQPAEPPKLSLKDQIEAPAIVELLAQGAPGGYSTDRLVTAVYHLVRSTPKLGECSMTSIAGAMMTCAQIGIYPGAPLNHAWLVPRWNSTAKCQEAHFQLGWPGILELARRSGTLGTVDGGWVFAGELVRERYGTDPCLEVVPIRPRPLDTQPDAYWCSIEFLNGARTRFKVTDRDEIVEHAKKHAPKDRAGRIVGPWSSDFDTMAVISVLRSMRNWLPLSTDLADALDRDGQPRHIQEGGDDSPDPGRLPAVRDSGVPVERIDSQTGDEPPSTAGVPPFEIPVPSEGEPFGDVPPPEPGESVNPVRDGDTGSDGARSAAPSEPEPLPVPTIAAIAAWVKAHSKLLGGIKSKRDGGPETAEERIERISSELGIEQAELIRLIHANEPPPPPEDR